MEHLATRELFLTAVPLYVTLADFFIVIAPPTVHNDSALDLTTHLHAGWSCEGGNGEVGWERSFSAPLLGLAG